jgi:hypothetical protein
MVLRDFFLHFFFVDRIERGPGGEGCDEAQTLWAKYLVSQSYSRSSCSTSLPSRLVPGSLCLSSSASSPQAFSTRTASGGIRSIASDVFSHFWLGVMPPATTGQVSFVVELAIGLRVVRYCSVQECRRSISDSSSTTYVLCALWFRQKRYVNLFLQKQPTSFLNQTQAEE